MTPKSLVYTNDNCVGCGKCISACNCIGACVPIEGDEPGRVRILVDPERCIGCGACFSACERNAREYSDDTDDFFNDLKAGEQISVLVPPSFPTNYPNEYETVLAGLKNLGVNRIIDISFGAEIAAWCYANYVKSGDYTGMIAQPCPAVVNYIEKYRPGLINRLFPVQSPLMCAAVYIRKYLGINDRLALISPCIAKKIEMEDPNTGGLLSYNVTFLNLMKRMRTDGIDTDVSFSGIESSPLGSLPMPGGLKQNILWLLGEEVFIRQVEGEKRVYRYLKNNADKIADGRTGFDLIQAINCENGCMCGTATELHITRGEDPLIWLLEAKASIKRSNIKDVHLSSLSPDEKLKALNDHFKELDMDDFKRVYSDKSAQAYIDQPSNQELNSIFWDMRKYREEDRHINCNSCGCDTCRNMAVSIYNGFNTKTNCVYYVKSVIEEEQDKLRFLAEHDQSLLIYNRRTITEMLETRFSPEDSFSVLLADINNFKGLNATYGNAGGDVILRNVAVALSNICAVKGWECGRYGGDEFLIIAPGMNLKPSDPDISDLIDSLTIPTPIDGEWVSATVSLGISNSDGVTATKDHISCAEGAVRLAKTKGRNTIIEYSPEQKQKSREENEIREQVKYAIENEGFFMVYQPQVDARTRSVSGYEALVRMKTPGIYPGQFIPIAEKNGWIWQIGRITTELVIKQLAKWIEEGYKPHPVSINFSSNQLSDEGYIDFLEDLLKSCNIPASLVEIEITEGLFLEKSSQALELFERFRKLGIRLLMDDFGTGYSSLGYLTYIPVDVVKLDKSLVDTYLVEGKDSFIHNVIQLMHDLGKEMLIEGVEEKWQYERLCELGADTIQGYYFSKPVPPEEAIEFTVR